MTVYIRFVNGALHGQLHCMPSTPPDELTAFKLDGSYFVAGHGNKKERGWKVFYKRMRVYTGANTFMDGPDVLYFHYDRSVPCKLKDMK